jgi:ribose transport system substrate-binding protein
MSARICRSPAFLFGLLLSLAALAIGCNRSDQSGPKKLRIAVIPKGTTHEFWKSVHAGADQAAKDLGTVTVYWKGPLREDNRDEQITVVENFIAQSVDGIVLAPLDQTALVAKVAEADRSGIPTVIFDSGLDEGAPIVSYVATDNFHGGELAGREMGKLLGGKGNVILLRYNVGSESTFQREEGFLKTLAKEFPQITVLSENQYSGTTPETSLNKMTELLNQFGDKLDGVFAVCEPNSTGVLGALEQQGLAGKVKFIDFDPSPALVDAMAQNKIHAIILQDPVKMGYEAVKTMVAHLNKQKVEKRVSTGETVATPDNMRTPQIQKLLDPVQAD